MGNSVYYVFKIGQAARNLRGQISKARSTLISYQKLTDYYGLSIVTVGRGSSSGIVILGQAGF